MNKKDYKQTLNMPTTAFSMKANLKEKEITYQKLWQEQQLYQQVLAKNKANPAFILHDGPPYANGDLHIGHALNKILKDFVVRYKSMQGFYTPFVPGWDTHGLPIENQMLKVMNLDRKKIDIVQLRKNAAQYAKEQILSQKEQFLRFQLLADFQSYYSTLTPDYEVKQLKLFKKMCLDGLIYKGLKPVYWSPSSQSALAEAEVEYHNHVSPSIFVACRVHNGNSQVTAGSFLVIWTTTPWTLVANSAIAINIDFKYVLVEAQQHHYVVLEQLLNHLVSEWNWQTYKIKATFKGEALIGLTYDSPLNKLVCPVVNSNHVSFEAGTGLVHIAPLFGEDDFNIGKKYALEMIMHINDDGTLNDYLKAYHGLFYEKANEQICADLAAQDLLLAQQTIEHSYPHDWRTKKPIIFRGTPQWFVSIDKIRTQILQALDQVQFYVEWGHKRLLNMIENREDWTISRQRAWGVPIIIFYDQAQKPVIQADVFDHVINLVAQHGTDIWYQKTADELLPLQYQGLGWTKENDIMDVWFDSGVSFLGVTIENFTPPFDLYLEGSDQYRGWFNSSLINAVTYLNQSPYKALLSHGFLVDEKGRKMSKSLGNGVDPMKIINQYGADVLRLWVANSEYFNDIAISDNIILQTAEMYRKIRNSIRFLLANLDGYQPKETIELTGVHQLIAQTFHNLKVTVLQAYNKYHFISVIKNINNFITDLSSFYFSISKDILYIAAKTDPERQMVQHNFYYILDFLLITLAPIMPTTCEEAYSHFAKANKCASIHLESFYNLPDKPLQTDLIEAWKPFFGLKDQVYKMIEMHIQKGTFKRSNEAHVQLDQSSTFLKSLDLKRLLMVGKISFGSKLEVSSFDSIKCQRCWNHFEATEINGDLCLSCGQIVNDYENQ